MGIPVGIDVRDPGVDPAALDRAFAWLRWVDATFSTYRPDSAISRLNAGTLALGDAAPRGSRRPRELRGPAGAHARCFDVRARGASTRRRFVKGWAVEPRRCARARRAEPVRARRRRRARARRANPGEAVARGIHHPCGATAGGRARPRGSRGRDLGAYERGHHIVDPRTGGLPAASLSRSSARPPIGRRLRHRRVRDGRRGARGRGAGRVRGADDPRRRRAARRPASTPRCAIRSRRRRPPRSAPRRPR